MRIKLTVFLFLMLITPVVNAQTVVNNWIGGTTNYSTGSNWSTGTAPFGYGNTYANINATIDTSGTIYVNNNVYFMQIGDHNGAAYQPSSLTITGGARLMANMGTTVYSRAGEININNATLYASELFVANEGPGELTLTQGGVHVINSLIIATLEAAGPVNRSMGLDSLIGDGAIKEPNHYAEGTLTQTGGAVSAEKLTFTMENYASNLPAGHQTDVGAEYIHSGGTLTVNEVLGNDLITRDGQTITGESNSRWTISGNAVVNVAGNASLAPNDSRRTANFEMNVFGGKINIAGLLTAEDSNNMGSHVLNIYGSNASMNVGMYNVTWDGDATAVTSLDSNFYLVSDGASMIVASEYASVASADQAAHTIGVYGFAALTEERYDLIVARYFIDPYPDTAWSIDDQTGVGFKAGHTIDPNGTDVAYIYLDGSQPTPAGGEWKWNEDLSDNYYEITETSGLWEQGAIKVDGERIDNVNVRVYLSDEALDNDLASLLVDFLNSNHDGLRYTLVDDLNAIMLSGSFLNNNGDAYYAWDLGMFNELYGGAGVGIIGFDTVHNSPEPATWAMLLLGSTAMVWWRRKQQSATL